VGGARREPGRNGGGRGASNAEPRFSRRSPAPAPPPNLLDAAASRGHSLRWAAAAGALAVAGIIGLSATRADAQSVGELQSKIDSAQSEAQSLSSQIELGSAQLEAGWVPAPPRPSGNQKGAGRDGAFQAARKVKTLQKAAGPDRPPRDLHPPRHHPRHTDPRSRRGLKGSEQPSGPGGFADRCRTSRRLRRRPERAARDRELGRIDETDR